MFSFFFEIFFSFFLSNQVFHLNHDGGGLILIDDFKSSKYDWLRQVNAIHLFAKLLRMEVNFRLEEISMGFSWSERRKKGDKKTLHTDKNMIKCFKFELMTESNGWMDGWKSIISSQLHNQTRLRISEVNGIKLALYSIYFSTNVLKSQFESFPVNTWYRPKTFPKRYWRHRRKRMLEYMTNDSTDDEHTH